MDNESKEVNPDREWAQRVLCSDESCIGVIGPDGRCKECGQPYAGQLPDFTASAPDDEAEAAPEHEIAGNTMGAEDASGQAWQSAEDAMAEDDDEWSGRRLCSDGNCIGVIGPDGRCKECGRPEST
ncbi:MAG: hypothetical protein VR64_09715 [Desulfatitalea sp. BRH_c12]|nr:MAG: hypothetical protein VR64_09715 [Desulfatitalea sp. BRH_c12]